jgi:hypothetical protein
MHAPCVLREEDPNTLDGTRNGPYAHGCRAPPRRGLLHASLTYNARISASMHINYKDLCIYCHARRSL